MRKDDILKNIIYIYIDYLKSSPSKKAISDKILSNYSRQPCRKPYEY